MRPIADQRTVGELRKLAVISRRQIGTDFADLLLDEMVVVEQPLGRRRNGPAVISRLRDVAIGLEQDTLVLPEETRYLRDEKDVQTDGMPTTDVELAQADQDAGSQNVSDTDRFGGRDPSKFYLKFDGRYLKLYNGDEVVNEWPAVSGRENFGSGRDQNKRNYGPIPEGTYDIKQSRYQTIDAWNAVIGLNPLWKTGRWAGSTLAWGA